MAPTPAVLVPCPVCGTTFAWPPGGSCATCHADLTGPLAAVYWQLAHDEVALHERQREVLAQLTQTADLPARPAVRQPRHRLTDLRAQTVLGLVGAALLATAAIVFAAVTWQDLPSAARGAILVGAAGLAVLVTRWLHTRGLHVTAGATGLLADALVATVVWAAHTYGATGDLVDSAGVALAAVAATSCAVGLSAWRVRWQPWAAGGAWLAAAVAGATAVATNDGAVLVLPVGIGFAGALLWLRYAPPLPGTLMATVTIAVLALGSVVTFGLTGDTQLAVIAAAGLALVTFSALLGNRRRALAVLLGAVPLSVPPTLVGVGMVLLTAGALVGTVGDTWTSAFAGPMNDSPSLAAVPPLVAAMLVAGLLRWRPAAVTTTAAVTAPIVATAAVWWLDGAPAVLAALAAVTAVVGWLRIDRRVSRVLFTAGTGVATMWLLPWPAATFAAGVTVLALAVTAGWAPVGRHAEQAPMAVLAGALAVASAVVWIDPPRVAPLAGLAAVGVAVAVALAGRWIGLHGIAGGVAVAVVGAVAAATSGVTADLSTAAAVTGTLAAGGVVLAGAWRHESGTAAVYGLLATTAATVTSWLLLWAAEIDIVEAYSALPAAIALLAGAVWMHRDPTVRSRRALHPGLLLAVVPTLLVLIGDVNDLPRALAAASMAAVLLLAGVLLRVEVPVWYGLAAGLVVTMTQLVVVAGHVPRWTVFATLGAILVAASATFEHQRDRARRLQTTMRHVTDDYR